MAEDLEDTTLYVRGMSTADEEIEDVWDDTVLNNAYDKALKLANEQVAKRIAMETNSKKKEDVKPKPKKTTVAKPHTEEACEWKAGMPCRAIYDDDGLEYEAFLVKIINDKDCIVKFLGYDNSERVPISSLQKTLGDEERMRQVEAALGERADDGFGSQTPSDDVDGASDVASPEPAERPSNKNKKAHKKKKNHSHEPEFGGLPPLNMPNMSMFANMNSDMPMPPPPPLASSNRSDAEEQAISDMLLSWYMTGYYTGLYQGMKRQRQSRRYN